MANILLIEDLAAVRRAVSSVLKKAGHMVSEAEDGAAGLKLAAAAPFDLVITDIMMPGVDGTAVIVSLQAQPNRPQILVISDGGAQLSSKIGSQVARNLADAAIAKPFASHELLDVVEQLLGRPRLARMTS